MCECEDQAALEQLKLPTADQIGLLIECATLGVGVGARCAATAPTSSGARRRRHRQAGASRRLSENNPAIVEYEAGA